MSDAVPQPKDLGRAIHMGNSLLVPLDVMLD